MIHIFIGTKAQFIKMAPIVQELSRRGIDFNFIDAGQHAALTGDLIRQFGVREPDVVFRRDRSNINTLSEALAWLAKHFYHILFKPHWIFERIFRNQKGICLIHGDTITTLVSLFYAKRCGIAVAHVEAGLRSFDVFDPFPEEIIRRIAMFASDVLFAPTDVASRNLDKMGYREKTINVGANTGLDAVLYAAKQARNEQRPSEPYALMTIHRVETLYSRSRLAKVVEIIQRSARDQKVVFVLHQPTRKQLERFGFLPMISGCKNVILLPLLPYLEFMGLLTGAEYVMTDGGSIQEECYYLNKPCMVLRSRTERMEGLGENACLVEFENAQIEKFFETLQLLKRRDDSKPIRPSSTLVDHLLPWA